MENLRVTLALAQNETAKWRQRCEDLENSRVWRYTKPARKVATMIKIANRRFRETGSQRKHDARKSLKIRRH